MANWFCSVFNVVCRKRLSSPRCRSELIDFGYRPWTQKCIKKYRSKLYEELGWESLSDRRWCRRIPQIHKIVSDKTHSYLKHKVPRLRRLLCRQINSNTFHELKCKSLRYMSSFFPDAITSWNNVSTHFNDIPSISVLKNYILSLVCPNKKSIFGIHDPFELRYLFQLRMVFSSLRYQRMR